MTDGNSSRSGPPTHGLNVVPFASMAGGWLGPLLMFWLLFLGLVSAAWALVISWHGWALYLSLGNLAANLYPILLQRYTRARIRSVLGTTRIPDEGPA